MADEVQPTKTNPLADDGLPIYCRDCLWYSGNVLSGVCRGAPPTTVIVGVTQNLAGQQQPQLGSFWPSVSGDRFCGQFKPDRDKMLDPLPSAPSSLIMPAKIEGSA